MARYKTSDGKYYTQVEISNVMSPFSGEGLIFEYKNYKYIIRALNLFGGENDSLAGYVFGVDNQYKCNYEPHGGFTGSCTHPTLKIGIGFDCSHCDDITMNAIRYKYVEKEMSFKLPSFVHNECKKIIDSIKN
jgi:hypothetical protein